MNFFWVVPILNDIWLVWNYIQDGCGMSNRKSLHWPNLPAKLCSNVKYKHTSNYDLLDIHCGFRFNSNFLSIAEIMYIFLSDTVHSILTKLGMNSNRWSFFKCVFVWSELIKLYLPFQSSFCRFTANKKNTEEN